MKGVGKEYKSTHERLEGEGFIPEQGLEVRRKIVTSELGKRYALVTTGREPSVVYTIDGDIIKDGRKCDKLVLVKRSPEGVIPEKWTESFVELKGRDVSHAIKQLRETLKNLLFKHSSNEDIRARIVAQSFPANKANPSLERAKREFRREFDCDLRGMKTGQADRL